MSNSFYAGLLSWFLAAVATMVALKFNLPEPQLIRASSNLFFSMIPVVLVGGIVFGALQKTRFSEFGAQAFFGSAIYLFGTFIVGCLVI